MGETVRLILEGEPAEVWDGVHLAEAGEETKAKVWVWAVTVYVRIAGIRNHIKGVFPATKPAARNAMPS